MDLKDYNFNLEAAYSLIPEEEINYVEPGSEEEDEDLSSSSDNESVVSDDVDDVDGDGDGIDVDMGATNLEPEVDLDFDLDLGEEGEDKIWTEFMTEFYADTKIDVDEPDEQSDLNFECDYESSSSSEDESESESGSSSSDSDDSRMSDGSGDLPATYPYMDSDYSDPEEDVNPNHEIKDRLAYDSWLKSTNPITQVITLDSDEEEVLTNKDGQMQCLRCPEKVSVIKDKSLFLHHRERHMGPNHFVCPTCSKPFIKLSSCFAHEVRAHGTDFPFQNPAITAAVLYRKNKLEWERQFEKGEEGEGNVQKDGEKDQKTFEFDDGMDPDFFDDVEPPPIKQTLAGDIIKTPYCTNFAGLVLFPEEGELETDEDDPKFHPDHAVPSTALYPYRGLEPLSMYDCYEIHLRYGRKKRTAANTIARCAMARRRRLIEEGSIAADDISRFWKPPPIAERASTRAKPEPKRKRGAGRRGQGQSQDGEESETSSTATSAVAGGSKKRKVISEPLDESDEEFLAQDEEEDILRRKKRRIAHAKKQPPAKLDVANRTFAAGIIARTCLICGFSWKSEAELKTHRDEKHPRKTLVELMTLVRNVNVNPKKKVTKKKIESQSEILPKRKKRKIEEDFVEETCTRKSSSQNEPLFDPILPIHVRNEKEDFLFTALGLITQDELSHIRSRKPLMRTMLCYVEMIDLPKDIASNNVQLYACPNNSCDYYNKSRDLVARHTRREHSPEARAAVQKKKKAATVAVKSCAKNPSSSSVDGGAPAKKKTVVKKSSASLVAGGTGTVQKKVAKKSSASVVVGGAVAVTVQKKTTVAKKSSAPVVVVGGAGIQRIDKPPAIAKKSCAPSTSTSAPGPSFPVSTNPNAISKKEQDRIRFQQLVDLINARKFNTS